jgi:hypothetical protein
MNAADTLIFRHRRDTFNHSPGSHHPCPMVHRTQTGPAPAPPSKLRPPGEAPDAFGRACTPTWLESTGRRTPWLVVGLAHCAFALFFAFSFLLFLYSLFHFHFFYFCYF